MENTGVELLATLLNKTSEQVTEALGSEDSLTALKEEVSNLKVYDTDGLNSVLGNAKRDYKDKVYSEVKGSVLEKYEKELKKSNGVEHLKAGVDYNSTMELNAKILELKSVIEPVAEANTPPVVDDSARRELEEARALLTQREEEYKKKEKELVNSHNNQLFDNQVNSELNKFKSLIDVKDEQKDGQIAFLKYEFQKRYELQNKDGQTVVFDKTSNDIAKDGNLNYLSLSSVVDAFAPQFVSIKEQLSVVGRGNINQQNKEDNPTRINWQAFDNSYDTYYDQVLKGKGVKVGSMEAMEAFNDFKTNVG